MLFFWNCLLVFFIVLDTVLAVLSPTPSRAARTSDYEQRSCTYAKGLHTNLIRFITGEGFNRDLEDTLEITVTTSPIPIQAFTSGECVLGLLHELSKDVFVDPYQLKRHPVLSNYIRVLNNWTDLEGPAWLAKSNSTVFIQLIPVLTGNLISTEIIPLPIHYRYQLPRSHSRRSARATGAGINPVGYITVGLPLPEIILRCRDWDSAAVEEQCKTVSVICHRKAPPHLKCPWVMLPYRSNLKSGLVHIPVGDIDSTLLVTGVTIGVVICGSFLVIVTLLNTKKASDEIRDSHNAHPHND